MCAVVIYFGVKCVLGESYGGGVITYGFSIFVARWGNRGAFGLVSTPFFGYLFTLVPEDAGGNALNSVCCVIRRIFNIFPPHTDGF